MLDSDFTIDEARIDNTPIDLADLPSWRALARAIIASAVGDLADSLRGPNIRAHRWLHCDSDPDLVEWRTTLFDLGDVDLYHLRRILDDADRRTIKRVASKLANRTPTAMNR